jgi:hypothetical protein
MDWQAALIALCKYIIRANRSTSLADQHIRTCAWPATANKITNICYEQQQFRRAQINLCCGLHSTSCWLIYVGTNFFIGNFAVACPVFIVCAADFRSAELPVNRLIAAALHSCIHTLAEPTKSRSSPNREGGSARQQIAVARGCESAML